MLHAEDTEEPAEDADELSEIIEFGRREDFMSGNVPTNELRNLGAVMNQQLLQKSNKNIISSFTFAKLRETNRTIVNLIAARSNI